VALYEEEGRKIFDRSLWHHFVAFDNLLDEKYGAKGLEAVLKKYFGDVMLGAAVTETLVTSYELETRQPWFFARHKAQAARERATSRCGSSPGRPRPPRPTSSPRK
jgi:patatin-like phospholipase/acyl hydrolase